MINGLYNSASGMNAELARQDAIANNLANVNTTGFKKDETVEMAFPNVLVNRINDKVQPGTTPQIFNAVNPVLGEVGHGVQVADVATDMSNGMYVQSQNPLDLALEGNALFTLQLKDGSTAYTRSGNFTLDSQGRLITQAGDYVMGKRGGPIQIQGNNIVVNTDGSVIVDGVEADELLLTAFEKNNDLQKRGENIFLSQNGQGLNTQPSPMDVNVKQGFLESANVSSIKEMVDMITVQRAYEANQKAIQAQDTTLDELINQVGKVS